MRLHRLVPFVITATLPAAAWAQTAAQLNDVRFGEDVRGALSADDPVCARGGNADRYTFHGAAGTSVEVSLASDVFDTYLILEAADGSVIGEDDDSGSGTDSRLMATLPSDGRYTIVATSYATTPGTAGDYVLRVSEFVPRPLVPATVSVGDVVTGSLDEADAVMANNGYVDAFDIEIGIGERVRFDVESRDFDTYAYLIGPTGERIAEDDDGAPYGTNSRIDFRAQSSGGHRLLVTSYGGFATGAYTLRVGDGTAIAAAELPALPIGSAAPGELAEGDAPSGTDGYQDEFAVTLEIGQQLVVSLSSSAFDAYLTLRGPDGLDLAYDDDSGGGYDSRLSHVATAGGTYTVVASSYDGSGGTYTIRGEIRAPRPVTQTALSSGVRVTGRLEDGDARSQSGGVVDVYTYDGTAGETIDVDIEDNYEVHVQVYSPTGEPMSWDYQAPFGAGFLNMGLPYTGRYLLTVGTYGTGPLDYALTVRPAGSAADVVSTPITVGVEVVGELSDTDPMHPRGGRQDSYLLRVDSPTNVRISMMSDTLDGYLELYDEDGVEMAYNDDTVGLNPAIRQFLPPGEYRIVATEYAAGGGSYTLSVVEAAAVQAVVSPVSLGDHVIGRIDETDAPSVHQGNSADFYRIELGAGQQVTVTMISQTIDAYLLVVDPTGAVVASDDDSGGNLDAQANFTAATAGLYTIVATGYDERYGEYELHVYEGALAAPIGPEL